jgi:hypothetical protein
MPSLLMQCSKIAGEPKNVGSRLEVQVFGSRAEIVHWQASLVARVRNSLTGLRLQT